VFIPMSKKSVKYLLTETINSLLPSDKKSLIPTEKLIFKWFVTGRMGNGLRLTPEGMEMFDAAGIDHFEYPFFKEGKSAIDYENFNIHEFTLKVGKLITCPFYLGVKHMRPGDLIYNGDKIAYIKLYNSKLAMMISLYGANLYDYIKAVGEKNE
jgi:hypothetical protein